MSILSASRTRLIGVDRGVSRRTVEYKNVLSVRVAIAENISLTARGRAVGIDVHPYDAGKKEGELRDGLTGRWALAS